MKGQQVNPYLPSYEYVPDGEPRVFGDRAYIFGSHDRFNGKKFCLNDYICYSAPVKDLSDWRYEGVIYRATQDPRNAKRERELWAPDVICGKDGKYYLYYSLSNCGHIGVAVCDTPCGKYEFLGYVKYNDGTVLGEREGDTFQFDPGIFIDDDEKIYLYSGNAQLKYEGQFKMNWFSKLVMKFLFKTMSDPRPKASIVCELEDDMLTVKGEYKRLIPGMLDENIDPSFKGHEFFEASSIRKINGKYYFIYSSCLSHELCYAISDYPDKDFKFGGTLVSIADVGYKGREKKDGLNYFGNTHGSIAKIDGSWYVFYHRQTNRHSFSRQACAEKIEILPDGSIPQVEITSQGLNGKPLVGRGKYEARIACNLMSKNGVAYSMQMAQKKDLHPAFTQSGVDREDNPDQYIAGMRGGAVAGFKYFEFDGLSEIAVTVRGKGKGTMLVTTELRGKPIARIEVKPEKTWQTFKAASKNLSGISALYFEFETDDDNSDDNKSYVDFTAFELL